MTTHYHASLGQTKRKAAQVFLRNLLKQIGQPTDGAEVVPGPEGQVLVYYYASQPGTAQLRRLMSELSYKTLDHYGVWVIGIPMKKPLSRVARRA